MPFVLFSETGNIVSLSAERVDPFANSTLVTSDGVPPRNEDWKQTLNLPAKDTRQQTEVCSSLVPES